MSNHSHFRKFEFKPELFYSLSSNVLEKSICVQTGVQAIYISYEVFSVLCHSQSLIKQVRNDPLIDLVSKLKSEPVKMHSAFKLLLTLFEGARYIKIDSSNSTSLNQIGNYFSNESLVNKTTHSQTDHQSNRFHLSFPSHRKVNYDYSIQTNDSKFPCYKAFLFCISEAFQKKLKENKKLESFKLEAKNIDNQILQDVLSLATKKSLRISNVSKVRDFAIQIGFRDLITFCEPSESIHNAEEAISLFWKYHPHFIDILPSTFINYCALNISQFDEISINFSPYLFKIILSSKFFKSDSLDQLFEMLYKFFQKHGENAKSLFKFIQHSKLNHTNRSRYRRILYNSTSDLHKHYRRKHLHHPSHSTRHFEEKSTSKQVSTINTFAAPLLTFHSNSNSIRFSKTQHEENQFLSSLNEDCFIKYSVSSNDFLFRFLSSHLDYPSLILQSLTDQNNSDAILFNGLLQLKSSSDEISESSLNYIKLSSDLGNYYGQYEYAKLIYSKKVPGVEKKEAKQLLDKISSKKFPLGLVYKGIYLFQEENDHAKANDLILLATNSFDSQALIEIGLAYENGLFGRTPTDSSELYQRAAKLNNSEGMWRYAESIQKGFAPQADQSEISFYLKKSAELKNPEGMLKYSSYNGESKSNITQLPHDEFPEDKGNVVALIQNGDIQQLAQQLLADIDKGKSEAMWMYGELVEKGFDDLPPNKQEATKYYRLSAEAGDPFGLCLYGKTLEKGYQGQVDLHGAALFFKLSADLGDPEGMCCYGVSLMLGYNGRIDLRGAAKYFKMSADANSSEGLKFYGIALDQGFLGNVDRIGAMRYYKLAAHLKNSDAMRFLAYSYLQGSISNYNPEKARKAFKKSADLGNDKSMYQYASLLQKGIGGPADTKEAFQYFIQSATLGCIEAMFQVGCIYETGGSGIITPDPKLAFEYYKKSAEKGYMFSMTEYARFLAEGKHVSRDLKTAINFLNRSKALGDSRAAEFLKIITNRRG